MLDWTDSNAASFDLVRDDVFSRIASRYDVLCDLFSLERLSFGIVAIHVARKRLAPGG